MKLSDIINESSIIPELNASDKKGVLEELAEVIVKEEASIDKSALMKVLVEREHLGTTGIGDGVAIPHGKLDGATRPMISFGRSTRGLDFDSMDGLPAHLFFLIVAPENSSGTHLQVLAKIAKLLKNSAFRKKLIKAKSSNELYQAIIQTDEES